MPLEKSQVERFIALGYATDSFKFAQFDCRQLVRVEDYGDFEWFSRVTSLVTHYARPFKRARAMLALGTDFIPAEFRELHTQLIQARDKAHAHLDGDLAFNTAQTPVHRIYLLKEVTGKHHWLPTRALLIEKGDIPRIELLLAALLSRLDKETDDMEGSLMSAVNALSPGLHTLSTSAPYFEKDTDQGLISKLSDIKLIK